MFIETSKKLITELKKIIEIFVDFYQIHFHWICDTSTIRNTIIWIGFISVSILMNCTNNKTVRARLSKYHPGFAKPLKS